MRRPCGVFTVVEPFYMGSTVDDTAVMGVDKHCNTTNTMYKEGECCERRVA